MKYFRLACGCLFCVAVFAMTACKPKPRYQMVGEPSPEQPPATSSPTNPAQLPTPSPLPSQPSEGQGPGLATLASSVRPAIILVTVFDASGKLLRTGTGFFVADDGYLYCLDADSGELLWKFRGGPSDRKVLGNERSTDASVVLLDPNGERVQAEILPEVILQANLADVALEVLRERGANPGGDCRLRDHCMPPWTGWSGKCTALKGAITPSHFSGWTSMG